MLPLIAWPKAKPVISIREVTQTENAHKILQFPPSSKEALGEIYENDAALTRHH